MRYAKRDNGFLLCLLINMLFRAEWLLAAVAALIANYWFGLHIVIFWILLALWFLVSFLITLLLSAVSDTSPPPYQENKNPYSKTTEEYLKEQNKEERDE